MPPLPWVSPHPARPGATAYVLASRFEVKSFRNVPRFLVNSFAAWRQVRRSPGALGVSLDARPLKRIFYTLSAWEDREALQSFVVTEPHKGIMSALRPVMKSGTFTFWEVPADELPPDWADARRRVEEQARADARA